MKLDDLKKEYLKTSSSYLVETGWNELKRKLDKPAVAGVVVSTWQRAVYVAFMIVLVLLVGGSGLFKVAQAALPGEPLYTLKRFSEAVLTPTNPELKLDNRADEIVNLVKKKEDSEKLKKVVKEYKEEVSQNKQVEKSGKRQEQFEQKLEGHHQQFQQLIQSSSHNEKELKEALEVSQGSEDNQGKDK